MVFSGHNSKFSQWMANGLLSTIAWFIVLIIYCVFRAFGIEDPLLGQAFLLLTGAWVGNLTLAQGKKTAKLEEAAVDAREEAKEVKRRVDDLTEDAEVSRRRADDAERRESGWSKHRDHSDRDEDD